MKRIKEFQLDKKEMKIVGGKNKMDKRTVSYQTNEWIKKSLGTVDADGLVLRGIEMSGERGIIIEYWSL